MSKPSMSLRRPPDPIAVERFVGGAAPAPTFRAEVERRLTAFCARHGLDRNRVIEAALECYLDAQERPTTRARVAALLGQLIETLVRRRAPV